MTLKVSSSLQCILTWLLYTDTMKWTTASSQPQVYGHLQQRKKVLTGGCPPARVDSEAACAMLCFLHAWCRVYVLGTCDPIYKNGCLCLICQMDPALDPNGWEYVSSRRLIFPKRHVDKDNCGSGPKWTNVHPKCRSTSYGVQSSLGALPILALRLAAMVPFGNGFKVIATPVCPPYFSPRGYTECSFTDGVWHNQASLACFPLMCFQRQGDINIYAGYKSVTLSGRPCWTWASQGPMDNKYLNRAFPFDNHDIVKAKSYCRSFPDDEYKGIWCYNANFDPNGDKERWEVCSIPQCHNIY
ncbi:hypothetical protein RRG08_030696 [Elysia crispata]|uniref:Kringle domain-containing protein n=1 Tax=Elysia crispata TaxID=231223 RepID=A0AAE0Y583_9GAST|nr:hypothetical protein RRG08_030696 [Elysia crispata]